jgi:hypothetical protein
VRRNPAATNRFGMACSIARWSGSMGRVASATRRALACPVLYGSGVPTGTASIQHHQGLTQKWDTELFHRIIRRSTASVPPKIPWCHVRSSAESRHWPVRSACPQSANRVQSAPQKTAPLFDHLVGAGEERRRHGEAKLLRSLEIDHQLVFGRRLHRQVGWLLTLEDAVNVASGLAILID